jgi:signal transduction histidine kinase
MRHILGETQAELRRAIWDMRQGTDGQPRLETLLERVLAQAMVPAGTRLRLQTGDNSVPVSGLAAHEVPLLVKEAVTNAIRHAQAKHIEVGVLSDEDGLSVWVNDDGRGMRESHGGGYGLIGMHERARRMQGQLSIRSAPGEGTRVGLFVPRTRAN